MPDEMLLKEFGVLRQPGAEAALEYAAARGSVQAELEAVMAERGARSAYYPEHLSAMMQDNLANHFRYMDSVFQLYDVRSFVETVTWVFATYMGRGVRAEYWKAMLPECLDILRRRLTLTSFAEIAPFYEALLRNVDRFALARERFDFGAGAFLPKDEAHEA
ncbi:hypothetical protein [Paucidesulfovibrio longus]|uniref:hypothetical protein n=1 Tax=Paucidesulfovibrio longus TaxID=889 RepID=UPI0003B45BD3|nr:hypothetical protein [Paucidesulfovibrio longus]